MHVWLLWLLVANLMNSAKKAGLDSLVFLYARKLAKLLGETYPNLYLVQEFDKSNTVAILNKKDYVYNKHVK